MRFNEFKRLKLDDYYWRLIFGSSKYKASFFELRAKNFKDLPPPVFFLSTGRCGTNWFTVLLSNDNSLKVFHEPKPNLGVQGRIAYELYTRSDFHPGESEASLLREIVLTGREQYLRYSYKSQRRFVETNNQISFLAPAISEIFPGAKFIHLNRHPGEFVRSAMRRNFYNTTDDIKRIVPVETDPAHEQWNNFSPIEKNSWLWTATNTFIEKFKSTLPAENHYYFDFNKLDEDNIHNLCAFLNVDIDKNRIRKMLRQPVNAQQSGQVKGYSNWSNEEKSALHRICGGLASAYNYQL